MHCENTKIAADNIRKKASTHLKFDIENMHSRDRIVVSTLRCGRNNPGSNPGHGRKIFNEKLISEHVT